jgi:hypothetical protein
MGIKKGFKKAKAGAARVKKSLDDVLVDSVSLQKLRQQIALKKMRFEKESELATELALQILERAKSIRQKLQRKSKTKKSKKSVAKE